MLLVLNKDDRSVIFVDHIEGETVASLRVDRNPHEAILTPDHQIAYVSNAGDNTISIIEVKTRYVIGRITNPEWRFPHGLEVTPDGRYLWVAATYSDRLYIFRRDADDPLRHELVKEVETGHKLSHMIHFSPDASRAYVPNIGSGMLSVLDVEQMAVVDEVQVGPGPEGVAVHPVDGTIYVANQEDDTLMTVNPETLEIQHTLKIGSTPVRATFSPDGDMCLVSNRLSGDVSVIAHRWSGATKTPQPWEIKRIPVGLWPGQIVFDPKEERAWVTNNKTNDVSEIALGSLKEIRRIPAGIHPDGMIWIPHQPAVRETN